MKTRLTNSFLISGVRLVSHSCYLASNNCASVRYSFFHRCNIGNAYFTMHSEQITLTGVRLYSVLCITWKPSSITTNSSLLTPRSESYVRNAARSPRCVAMYVWRIFLQLQNLLLPFAQESSDYLLATNSCKHSMNF